MTANPEAPTPGAALAGPLLVVLAVFVLPGQTTAGAARDWLALGALPVLVALRPMALPRWLLPWVALPVLTLGLGVALGHPRAALHIALLETGVLFAAWLGVGLGPRIQPWLSAAGALAALPGLVTATGLFGNPDFLAAFLVGTVPFTVAVVRAHRLHVLSLGLQLAVLLRADSLGAWAALAAMAIALGLARRGWPRRLAALALVAGAALALTLPSVRGHLSGRAHLARVGLSVAAEAPIIGVGPGRFHGAFLEAQAEVMEAPTARARWTNAHHAHNEALHILAEQGPVALVLLLLPIGLALRRRALGPAWAATIGYGVLGTVTLPLYMPGAAALAGVCLGMAGGPSAPARRRWPVVILAALCLVAASTQLLADRLLRRADAEADAALSATAAHLALRPAPALRVTAMLALAKDPQRALRFAERADRYDRSVEGELLAGRIHMARGDPRAALVRFETAVRWHPRLFAGWFAVSRAHEDAGDRAAARRAADRARALRPTDPRLIHLPE